MAIFYAEMRPVSRSSGRSAVAAIAYRSAEKLTNERDGLVHDYTRKEGVEHSEIVLPQGVSADWALDRSTLWNAVEKREVRKDSRVGREFVLGLPHELSAERRLELTRTFAQDLADRYGAAVDFAIHAPHERGDVRNHHAHVMMTTRRVSADGLGERTYIELANKELLPKGLPTTQMQLVDIRRSWEQMANRELAEAGLDIRIDHRSHAERGLEIEPTQHMGVHATQMQRQGKSVTRTRMDEEAGKRNAELIREKPEQVLTLISNEKSVFDRHDVARALHRYINDDAEAFRNAFASVMASSALVELQPERTNAETGEIELARYSTREMVEVEHAMADRVEVMKHERGHRVDRHHVDRAIEKQDRAIRTSVLSDMAAKVERGEVDAGERDRRVVASGLSDEQRQAVEHITGPERIAAVVGYAGAGKSTMLAAAREAWEAQGYTVHGAALSGKAAEGLEESSGIASRTLASWDYNWQADKRTLGRGDVFVIDEAGMVGSRQLSRFVEEVEARGAKLVMVGDHEQLQAIGAGAPFRAIAEQVGHAELSEIRRQRVDWQREASVAFATHRTVDGLAAYRDKGGISFSETSEAARGEIVRDYLADREQRPDGSRVAMAHRRVDVRAINDAVRSELQERGELAKVRDSGDLLEGEGSVRERERERSQAFTYQTNDGSRDFAEGDRLVFLQNDRDLGVKNGMLGTVRSVEPDALHVELDGRSLSPGEEAGLIRVDVNSYQSFDHGYATTIHKNQGATVDRAFVMASATMDRHLTYVAMTRHRDGVQLYADAQEFSGGAGRMSAPDGMSAPDRMSASGRLVEHGAAPYENKAGNRQSYFVTLENDRGERHTTWGVDLGRAMGEAKPEIGDRIGLEHRGSETVRLPDGKTAERNAWKVQSGEELAFRAMEQRLSRSGVKETTLDYTKDFAERRGIAEHFGVRSEIDLAPAQKLGQEMASRPAHPAQELQDRLSGERSAYEERGPLQTDPDRGDIEQAQKGYPGREADVPRCKSPEQSIASDQPNAPEHGEPRPMRRSAFDGLKLSRGGTGSERPQPQERVEKSQETPQTAGKVRRGMFDGLKLNASPAPSRTSEREKADRLRPAPELGRPGEERAIDRLSRPSAFEQSVDRYARSFSAADKMVREGLPILESQKQEFQKADQQLEQARPGAPDLLVSAIRYDPETAQAMRETVGRERVGKLVAGMDRERALQADPNVRADRFVQRWQDLQAERQELRGWQHDEARGKVEGQMRGMAQGLERDPQVEAVLRNRTEELGIRHIGRGQTIAREMERQVQSRGQGLGMER